MKEKILNLKKEITKLSDSYEYLMTKDRERLKNMKKEYELLVKNLSKEDSKWIDNEFSKWYEYYLHLETVGSMRLPEG
jgi:hypothetical protein